MKNLLLTPRTLFLSWFGLGYAPYASGTWGSLGALPLYYYLQLKFGPAVLLIVILALFFAAWYETRQYLIDNPDKNDPSEIVVDEVIGQLIALIPAGLNPLGIVIGFFVFRLLDIVKPWPISWADRLKGGPTLSAFGVIFDDVLAGVLTAGIIVFWFSR